MAPVQFAPPIDELLAKGWIGANQLDEFVAVADVLVDDCRLGAIPPGMKTKSPHEYRYGGKDLETRLLAHALIALGIRNANVHPRERPDFIVSLSDTVPFAVEVAELHIEANARFTNGVADLHVGVRDAIDRARIDLRGHHASVRLDRPPISKRARFEMRDELVEFAAKDLEDWPNRESRPLDHYPMLRAHGAKGYVLHGAGCSFMIQANGGAYDPRELAPTALAVIERKRNLCYEVKPDWLVLCVTDYRGEFGASFDLIASSMPKVTPFRRIVLHDSGRVLILEPDRVYDSGARRRSR